MSGTISGDTRALALPNLLRGAIEAARDEADELGRLPGHLVTELRDAGAFSLFTPTEYGGLEVSLTTALTVYERLGRIDTSAAWIVWNANFGFTAATPVRRRSGPVARNRCWRTRVSRARPS
ncbi:acyl-CoA dehydrogenase family protein [Amycolatopsis azurea]|uniref:acyl-CoA dehydrogenase family protein n=1 Tax=Amycolatopsis azurea TaxID=36819 RepID=UPI003814FAA8